MMCCNVAEHYLQPIHSKDMLCSFFQGNNCQIAIVTTNALDFAAYRTNALALLPIAIEALQCYAAICENYKNSSMFCPA